MMIAAPGTVWPLASTRVGDRQRRLSTFFGRAVSSFLIALLAGLAACGGDADEAALPIRPGPRTETSHSVPHVQHFVEPVAEIDAELRRRVFSLPGVEERETIVSFTGTSALWLRDEFDVTDPAATMRDREFAHIHPDGSMHAVLPKELAIEATEAKWAELHPWVGREDFWDGLVMLYTPQSPEELETTWQLVVASYNLVTGQNLDHEDFN